MRGMYELLKKCPVQRLLTAVVFRAGSEAAETITVEQGPLKHLPGNMYEELRKLHLPVVLKKGILVLEEKFSLCRKDEVLTPEQAQALKLFNKRLASFKLVLTHRFREGTLTELNAMQVEQDDGY